MHFVLILYTPVYNMLSEFNIADSEVLNVLLNLDTTKAMGPDGIPPVVLQRCATALYQPLCYLFNLTLQFSYLPRDWKVHKIVPIFKSGDPTSVKNYRPISLLSNTSKVLERIIYNKMVDHISAYINPAGSVWIYAQSVYYSTATSISTQCIFFS